MWCHLPTGISRRRLLQFVAVASLFIAFFTTLVFAHVTRAAEGVNQTLAFQGRLAQSTGALVPDGHYNIQFKIYQDGTGSSANNGNLANSHKWTETYTNNNNNEGVEVKNGYFSVTLGSKTPFGSLVDWNQDTLWLSMNVAGLANNCTAFGSGSCTADGEMLPMKRMTATPFAINSAQLGGKTAENFIQLAQGVQEDASTNTASIAINKTGSGNFLQLQNSGTDVLRIDQSGNITMGSLFDHTISIEKSTPGENGSQLVVKGGDGGDGSGSTGGNLVLQGGDAGGTNGEGGNTFINAGSGTGTGNDGTVYIGSSKTGAIVLGSTDDDGYQYIGIGTTENVGGGNTVEIGSGAGAAYGDTTLRAKDEVKIQTNGVDRATFDNDGNLSLGNGVSSNAPSDFKIQGTDSTASGVRGGELTIQGGNATTGNANGGNLVLNGGSGSGSGTNGSVSIGTESTGDVNIGSSTGGKVNIQSGTDGVTVQSGGVVSVSFNTANVQVGDGTAAGVPTVLTLDKASSAPSLDPSLVGSMYYDTTLGKVQCYEADGWGDCGSAPDTFVALVPEYAGGIVTGSGTGTIATNMCSDQLNVNDGSSSQPTVCGTNETYNYYSWTSTSSTSQYKIVYVNYQLPQNFKQFVSGSTSILGRTSATTATVAYQLFRNSSSGLTACSTEQPVSNGATTLWQKAVPGGVADPATCGFQAGDTLVAKLTLGSRSSGNAYLSNYSFAYSTK